jgi:rubrerythrin
MMRQICVLGIMVMSLVCAMSAYGQDAASQPVEKTTLDNLMAAFDGESNANAKYLAFAAKADEEGYGSIASLFRAAARAEQIHLERHAEIIKALGGTAVADIKVPDVKTTLENLEAAKAGEEYESTVMYPEFLAKAEKDGNAEAIDSFEDAENAEAVHAGLYGAAIAGLETAKGTAKKDYFVCPLCGNVVDAAVAECPICGTTGDKFMTIS